ncbi:hypothetical protein C1646_775953 [Rhizophagus diaphanus]|nr:hypothetical protein C1646_775953 [Rhizophagus diaphanus] [Rhizophagus sp. MUCL 43196]
MNTFESNIQESVNTLITFHKVYHQDDTNDEQVETSNIASWNLESEDSTTSLCISHTYRSWNDVDVVMEIYDRHEDGSIKHQSFGCEFGSRYLPQKQININSHRDRKSKRQQCPWSINFNCHQNSQIITITTFNNLHNHALFPDTEKYLSKYCHIPENVLNEV